MKDRFLAIVNPAAGGGRSAKLAGETLTRLKAQGLRIDAIASTGPGHAVQLASEAYAQGYRRFLAFGGDGTAHEVVNGLRETELIALPGDAVLHDGMAVKIVTVDSAYVRGHRDGQ